MNLQYLADLLAGRPVLTRKDLARRYGRDLRTIDRWKADGTLPEPVWFHGPLWIPAQIFTAETSGKLKIVLSTVTDQEVAPQKFFQL